MNAVGVAALLLWPLVSSDASNVKVDLKEIFKDMQQYHNFMMPLLYANYLTYKTYPGPRRDGFINNKSATIPAEYSGGGTWTRMPEADSDEESGPHARAFVDHTSRRAIVAFRGACYDELLDGCVSDMALSGAVKKALKPKVTKTYSWWKRRWIVKTAAPAPAPPPLDTTLEDYVDMAVKHVEDVRKALPSPEGYSILVTGHALGAFLAAEACDKSKEDVHCQVVVLGGAPDVEKRRKMNVKNKNSRNVDPNYKFVDPEVQFLKLENADHFRLYDPVDLELAPTKRTSTEIGESTLCVFDDLEPPASCMECAGADTPYVPNDYQFKKLVGCREGKNPTGHYKTQCYDDTNWLDNWIVRILPSNKLPKCTKFEGKKKTA